MRTTTAPQQTVLTSAAYRVSHRVWVQNGSGTWKDLTALGTPAASYVISAEIDSDIDQPVAQATVLLKRDGEGRTRSLAPLRSDSTLNVLDDGVTYSALVDAGRRIKIEVATTAYGVAPVSTDWQALFEGVIDVVDFGDEPMRVVARDDGGLLVDRYTAAPASFVYALPGTALETVIQTILDAQLGTNVVPLWTPTSPAYNVKTFRHDREPTMDALQRLAQSSIGWDVRYWWKADTAQWRLRLGNPQRTKTVPDATLGAGMYLGPVRSLGIDRTLVRNRIEVVYGPANSRSTSVAEDFSSQNRFGLRVLHIEEDPDSAISTAAEAQAMADAILSDLALPKAALEVEMLPYWPVELFDLVRFSANGQHFNTDQDLAVVGVRHVLGPKSRTIVTVRGKPAGAYRAWQFRSFPTPTPKRAPPTCKIAKVGVSSRQYELVELTGELGAGDVGPLEWRYQVGTAAFSAWSTTALPQRPTITRPSGYGTNVILEVRQGDGQIARAYHGIPAADNDSGSIPREDRARTGYGGVPTPDAGIDPVPKYTGDGTAALIDTALGRLTANIKGPTGTFDGTVMERGAGRGDGGFTSNTGDLAATAKDSRTALVNGMFRYGTDGPDGVIESATKGFFHPLYRDASRRPVIMYDPTLAQDVAGNDINVGQSRARGGFTDATGGLASTAKDSRLALVNGMFRYGTDGAAGVVESATQSFTHQSYLDASRRPITMRNSTLARDVVANDIDVGQERARGGFTNSTGGLASTAADSRGALVNGMFRYGTDGVDGVVESGTKGFVHPSYTDASRRPTTLRDTGLAVDLTGSGIRTGWSRAAGTGAQGITAEGRTRAGSGGVDTPNGRINAEPLFDATGSVTLIDSVTKEIKPGLAIGAGVRGAADVAFGGSIKFATNRHNEAISGTDGQAKTFSISYEQVPELRVLPQTYKAPTAGNAVEFKAINPTVSGFTIRAVQISNPTTTARSADFTATLNGTQPNAAGVALGAPSSEAFCNLPNANTTPTTYKVFFDINTTSKSGGGLTRITAYKNNGVASTTWTQVGQNSYDDGVNLTGEHIDFSDALDLNWDIRLVVTYSTGTPSVNASVTADRVDYDEVTGGAATSITDVAGSSVLVQAVEKS